MTNTPSSVDRFFSTFQAFSFKTDDFILHKGEEASVVYYLKSGIIKQSSVSPQGQETIITFYKPGAFFPLIWAVQNTPVPYDFQALTNGYGWKAPKEAVIEFIKTNPEVSFSLTTRLLSGLEGLSRKVEFALQASAKVRVYETLLTLAYRFGKESDGHIIIDLTLTHQQIADLTGLTRETVSRELSSLQEKGVLRKEGQHYIIPEISQLEKQLSAN